MYVHNVAMCVSCYLVNSYRENQKKCLKGKSSHLDRTVWGCMEKANNITIAKKGNSFSFPLPPSTPLGTNIDTLLVGPLHVERSDFFSSFHKLLLKEKGITNVRVIASASVPIIKIEYENIEACST